MARYNMNKEIKEMAAITGKTEKEVSIKYGYKITDVSGEWEACNRSTQGRISSDLAKLKASKRAEASRKAFEQKLESGAVVWRKVGADWLAQVTGREVTAGDIIDVERKDGSTSKHQVKSIVSRGEYGIYCKV